MITVDTTRIVEARPPYDPDDLVKPDEHEPDDYFYFHSSVRFDTVAVSAQRIRRRI